VFRGGVNGNNKFRFETELELFIDKCGLETLDSNRFFDKETKDMVWLEQGCKCKSCNKEIMLTEAEADHIDEHKEGGQTTQDNCQILCNDCHKEKTKQYLTIS
jgi:hypothetical protein